MLRIHTKQAAVVAGIVMFFVAFAPNVLPAASPEKSPDGAELISRFGDALGAYAGKNRPGVVSVHSEVPVEADAANADFIDNQLYVYYGPNPSTEPQTERRTSSGILVSQDGCVVTHLRAVDGGNRIQVKLADGRSYDAEVMHLDAQRGLAVLQVQGGQLPVSQLASSEGPHLCASGTDCDTLCGGGDPK